MVRNRLGYPTYVLQARAFLPGALFFFVVHAPVVKRHFGWFLLYKFPFYDKKGPTPDPLPESIHVRSTFFVCCHFFMIFPSKVILPEKVVLPNRLGPPPRGAGEIIWYHMVPCGAMWCHMVPYGATWYPMVPCGTLWYHIVPFGTI